MLALEPTVVDAVWQSFAAYLPKRVETTHPLGCHRPRISDRDCFEAILFRLVTGCSWDVAGRLGKGGETTLRRRRDEWVAAGAFQHLVEEAINAFDKMIGLDLSEVSVDGSLHKAPMGGEGTGPNPTDRGKTGWKWSVATDANGVPIGWVTEGANRNDSILLAPTLDDVKQRGLLPDIETLWLDRGYDSELTRTRLVERGITDAMIAKKRKRGSATGTKHQPMGLRWPVERTNSWLSNFGQLRRNTDRFNAHRLAQFALAVALIITVKLGEVNRPGFDGGSGVWFAHAASGLRLLTVVGLDFSRRPIVELAVKSLLVEPGHPGAGGDLEVVKSLPGPAVGGEGGGVSVQLCLEQPHDRFSHRIVEAIADGPDRGGGTYLVDPFGVEDRGVLASGVGVADESVQAGVPPGPGGHVEGVDHQSCGHGTGGLPADQSS